MQKILVIDDSKMIRMRVREMLPSDNVEIIEAKDGKEGLDKIHSQKPQLIILDFVLPRVNGWEIYQEIQNTPDLNAVPLVIMSGLKDEVTEKVSEPFEHFAFVEKPFEREQLVKAIKEARTKASRRKATATSSSSTAETAPSQGGEDVAALKAQVAKLTEQVKTMQGQIDQLNKQLNQLVNFIKKKVR